MIRSVLYALALVGVTISPVQAAGSLSGLYAHPDCQSPKLLLVKSELGFLELQEEGVYLDKIDKQVDRPGWRQIFSSDTDWYFERTLKDGRLEYAFPPAPPKKGDQNKKAPDPDLLPADSWDKEVYEPCRALPLDMIALHGEAVAAFLQADVELRVCRADNTARCTEAVFRLIDVTEDKRLSAAEIARAMRIAAYFGVASNILSSSKDFAHALLWTHAAGPLIGKTLIASYDYDDDGGLSIDEITLGREQILAGAWHGKIDADDGEAVREVFDNLRKFPRMMKRFLR